MRFSISIDIAAPASLVRAVMADVERWQEWTATVTSIKVVGGGPIQVGSRMWIRQPKFPPAMWKVIAIDDTGFTSETWSPGVTVTARHWVEPTSSGSRATLSITFSGLFGKLVGRLTSALNNRYLAIEAAGLKRRSEDSEST